MSSHIIYKQVLLDERDLDLPADATPDVFYEALHDRIAALFPEPEAGDYILEILGAASERLDTTEVFEADFSEPYGIREGRTFRDCLLSLATIAGIADPDRILHLLETGPDRVVEEIAAQASRAISEGAYKRAKSLLDAIIDVRAVGIPCVRSCLRSETSGEDEVADLRYGNHGPGTRIFAEIAIIRA